MRSDKKVVVGVDIIRSGGNDLSKYLYAIAVVSNGVVKRVEEGGLGRLVRILWDNKASVLAVDNILELGGTKRNVIKLLKLLPPETEVIQVTLDDGKFTSLREVAFKAGLTSDKSKLGPVRTAVTLALLAEKGEGTKLKLFERKVKIIVSKGRSGYAGGSRSDKYQRNMRAAVSRVVKKIREELERRGFDYDVMIRRSRGGVERALFIVYADRKDLYGVVEKLRGYDVKVRIKPVINSKLFVIDEGSEQRKYLIVGYDPGIEAGLAALDLNGNPVLITSGRELDRGSALSILSKYGVVTVVATDKNPPPDVVRKLASSLNAQLYVPPHSLSTSEKELIVKEFCETKGVQVRNTHERDALAAAIKALRTFEQKMSKLQERIRLMGLKVSNIQEYKVRLLRNEPLSSIIEDIITDMIAKRSKGESRSEVIKGLIKEAIASRFEVRDKERRIRHLTKKVERLTKENEHLRSKIKELESIIREYEYQLTILKNELSRDVLKDRKIMELTQRLNNMSRYVSELRREIEELGNVNNSLRELIKSLVRGDLVATKVVTNLVSAFELKNDSLVIDVDDEKYNLLYLSLSRAACVSTELSRDVIELLRSSRVALILPDDCRELAIRLRNSYVPAVPVTGVVVIDDIALTNAEIINEVKGCIKDIKEAIRREEVSELTEEKLIELISSYRSERVKERLELGAKE